MARLDEGKRSDQLCKCGCGEFTRMWSGKPSKFVHGHNYKGIYNPRYKGYKDNDDKSRVLLYMPWHPNAGKDHYVYRYVWVMSRKIKRPLKPQEVVHHIDHNTLNDDPDNLMLFPNQSEHKKYEGRLDMSNRRCSDPECKNPTQTYTYNGYIAWYDDDQGGYWCSRCYRKRNYKYVKKGRKKNRIIL